jgi:hypothetical protein
MAAAPPEQRQLQSPRHRPGPARARVHRHGAAALPIAGLSDRGGYSADVEKAAVLGLLALAVVRRERADEDTVGRPGAEQRRQPLAAVA